MLDDLRTKAEEIVADDDLTRRPTWAPPLILKGELLDLLRELECLAVDEKPVARLWARFTDPRRGKVRCEGFELRAGQAHNGKQIFYAQYYDKARVIANLNRSIEETTRPESLAMLEEAKAKTEKKVGGWSFGPHWSWTTKGPAALRPRRLEKLNHLVDLGRDRVMDFCGAPDEQMRAGGSFCGHCCICGKGLTDPISVELGIGPECRHKFHVTVPNAPGAWIIGGSNEPAA